MKRIEARDSTGRIVANWPMDKLTHAQRLVSLTKSPWTIGIAELESEAEADAKRLDWLDTADNLHTFEWSEDDTLRQAVDFARNAPKPTFTPIETDTKPK